MANKKIAVLVGSLRKASLNRQMAIELKSLAANSLDLELIDLSQLPIYNQDLDDANPPPEAWTKFREKMHSFDGVLFVTPEYNRSIPGVLKNALDVGSRPYGKSVWDGKPGAVISVSPGAMGGFGANHHLRQCMVFLNVPMLQQPEMYLGGASKMFDANGKIEDGKTREFLQKFITAYANWVAMVGSGQR